MTSSSNVSRDRGAPVVDNSVVGFDASAALAENEFTHVTKTQKQQAAKRRKACGIGRLTSRRDGGRVSLYSNPSTFIEPRRFHHPFVGSPALSTVHGSQHSVTRPTAI